MIALVTAIVGIISTIVAYYLNPQRYKNKEINKIFNELDKLYIKRDIALDENDIDTLTNVVARINELRIRKDRLLQ